MPTGENVSDAVRRSVVDLNSRITATGQRVHTFADIASHLGLCERTVALIVRDYAAAAYRREKNPDSA